MVAITTGGDVHHSLNACCGSPVTADQNDEFIGPVSHQLISFKQGCRACSCNLEETRVARRDEIATKKLNLDWRLGLSLQAVRESETTEIQYGSSPFPSGVPQQYGGIAQKGVGGGGNDFKTLALRSCRA